MNPYLYAIGLLLSGAALTLVGVLWWLWRDARHPRRPDPGSRLIADPQQATTSTFRTVHLRRGANR